MADDFKKRQAEAEEYRRKQYAKRIEAGMKAQKHAKIKKYATYVGSVVMLIIIVVLIMQMGTGTFFADLADRLKTDTNAPAPEPDAPQPAEDPIVWKAPETKPDAAEDKNPAAKQQPETEQEEKPAAKPEKIEGTDLYEENPDGQTEITDISVARAEALYLKGDGNAWYLIKRGDTLSALATRFNLTVESIAKENDIRNVNLIIAGNELKMPVSAEVLKSLKE